VKNNVGLPTVIFGPDGDTVTHQLNEYTTISSYLKLINAYQDIARDFLK
jgi:succinyl-diaminopimelate desuccinylase